MKIFDILNEIANNPYPVELAKDTGDTINYKFVTDSGVDYWVSFRTEKNKDKRGAWLVVTAGKPTGLKDKNYKNKTGITGTGDQFRVFASIGNAINQYVNSSHQPDFITFTAREESRVKLYNLITRNISDYVSGWTRGKVIRTPKYTLYTVVKQK